MRRRRHGLALGLAATLLGCPRGEPSVPPDPGEPATDPTPAPQPDAAPQPPKGVCGTPAQRFTDYDWVPDDARVTTAIVRNDPDLPSALESLATLAASDRVSLPIRAALDYKNLGFLLAGLDRVIATVELDPAELVELHSPDGDVVWLWPSDCPTATLATRMLEHFSVMLRVDFDHPGVRLGQGSEKFPFDLVLVHERVVALAPPGRGAHVGAWLVAPHEDPDGPGVALASIDPAPIRSVLSGPALLAPNGAPPPAEERHRKFRATATACYEGESTTSND